MAMARTKKNRKPPASEKGKREGGTDDEKTQGIRLWRLLTSAAIAALASAAACVLPTGAGSGRAAAGRQDAVPLRGHNPAWALEEFTTRPLLVPDGNGTTLLRALTIEKLATRPPVLRVAEFLTPAECATLRRLAVARTLHEGYVDSDQALSGGGQKKKKMLILDGDGDGRLSVRELLRMVDDYFESHLLPEDVRAMLASIDLPLDAQGTVSIQAFVASDTAGMRRHFRTLLRETPSKRSRHSKMAWISAAHESVGEEDRRTLEAIRERVALLTQLPVHDGMELQVVHYEDGRDGTAHGGGRYTAHFDSLAPTADTACCHITDRVPPCRPCRMATILYSLSDEGGSTAFPLAGGAPHTAESLEEWRTSAASRDSLYCSEDAPGLRIRPRLGQAVLWYNHGLEHLVAAGDARAGDAVALPLLGRLDRASLHAGCPSVREGPPSEASGAEAPGKWIANHWLEASDVAGEDAEHWRRLEQGRRA